MEGLFSPLTFRRGPVMKNRFMLAPMTTHQCLEDGTVTEDEIRWLRARAQGGYGMVATCATHVSENGKGFWGELGIFSDAHLPGLARLAAAVRTSGALSCVELYHGGRRAVKADIPGPLVSPSDDAETGARALTPAEIEAVIGDFADAAVRAEKAGFDGVLLHAAHGYLISAFISAQYNRRSDAYGGSLGNRCRFLFEIIRRIRARCSPGFQLSVRLSPERFGHDLGEMIEVAQRLLLDGDIDFLDLSLWDVFKEPEDARFKGRTLISCFSGLQRAGTRMGVAGKLIQPSGLMRCMDEGADYVSLGKVGILHQDYPARLAADRNFAANWLPVSAAYLREQNVGDAFIGNLTRYTNFVSDLRIPEGVTRFDIDEYLKK
ncbi:MAG: NADH:flavin oxidoreductase [Burkholderiaceae bacterium]|nr:NADH:flavin oxidoreductase [Burkholderiaceae bacterium]